METYNIFNKKLLKYVNVATVLLIQSLSIVLPAYVA